MNIRTEFPHKIKVIENIWIPLADGTRLCAKIWMPLDAEDNPVPALFEYLPYRKNDGTAIRDARRQPYFAGHGYAAVRVDMRGSGDADGILTDEYLKQEQDDALEVLAWIADQPWCNGDIGMHGISWGGFNSLQIAARRPPQLKCLLVIGFTDDRYHDDVHYMGGCMLTQQMMSWSSVMFLYNPAPPDPRFVGERWRDMWLERLENNVPWAETWIAHQRRDAYWKHGSAIEDYAAIDIPVYAIGGWADSYNNSIPRLLTHLNAPRKGLIGPWSHNFPETGTPGPAIGFLQDSVRWWDHWLKGINAGIMDEPMLRTYIQDSLPPANLYTHRPGKWVVDPSYPSPHVKEQSWFLNSNGAAHTLNKTANPSVAVSLRGRQSHSLDAGEWGAYGVAGEFAGNQRAADGEALSFTTRPQQKGMNILGNPRVTLTLSADQPLALVAVRLCAVAPTGESLLVSWGLLNLTHRNSHEFPEYLTPGEQVQVDVPLNVCGHHLPAKYRWRVAVSPTYIRHAWPSPQPVTLTLHTGAGCQLHLPVRQPHAGDAAIVPFAEPEIAPPLSVDMLRPATHRQHIERDLVNNRVALISSTDDGRVRYPDGMEVDDTGWQRLSVTEADPLSTRVKIKRVLTYARGDWAVTMIADCQMWCDANIFYLHHHMVAKEGNTVVFDKTWQKEIPRDFM
jgi:putative CocE/NonD family hydrolase